VPRLKEDGHEVSMFFSNSNIDTQAEYEKRLEAARSLAEADDVRLVEDAYNHEDWIREVAAGYESEPEKGARCARCFAYNLARTAKYAAENGYDAFATSLTVSPHKPSQAVFAASCDERFLKADFKKKDGFKLSVKRASELGLYRQSWCGCEFSKQRISRHDA
jgi:predicted adenine nucleotide alpha hydrolase (AANH) superfamily ATPase